jgi:hypothetical protein
LPSVSPDVVGRRLDDRYVVVNLQTNRIYELNSTASVLWELLGDGVDASDLEGVMRERYDVPPDELRREIDGTLRTLTDAGLLTKP